jgi:MFS transporter, AAHS family, 4-hydroxybenzoate transporter
MVSSQTSIAAVIDKLPLGIYRTTIIVACFLIVLMDGFDTQAMGFVATAIASSLGIPIASFGQVFSAGLLGAMLGAFILGPVSDRFGRRWMLVGSIVLFSVFSLLTPCAPDLFWLLLLRFFAGLGLGGTVPNVLALSSEYSPRRLRGLLAGVLWAAFPLGGAAGALVSVYLLPLLGWPSLFYIGGAIPILLAAVVVFRLPESLQFLLRQPDGHKKVAAIIRRFQPQTADSTAVYVDTEERPNRLPVRQLFSKGRTQATALLWIACFMCFPMLVILVLWTPALLRGAGIGGTQTAFVVGLVNLGSVIGTALGGRLVDRMRPYDVLARLFIAGAFCVGPLGYATGSVRLLGLLAALSGLFLGAASAGLLALAVLIYPSVARATGVGWAMALGRTGQVIGPLLIGALLASGMRLQLVFLCCTVPAVCAAVAAKLLGWRELHAMDTTHRLLMDGAEAMPVQEPSRTNNEDCQRSCLRLEVSDAVEIRPAAYRVKSEQPRRASP